ncbi:sensor histidine kinase [Roseateles sp.]|uniref:sensor histidine kinase n=1 Tax=Roseateles sp. TaxID=1971397 RepID=UPI002F3E4A69
MSFARLREALGTSHFKVAAQFLLLFAVTGSLVLGLVYWRTSVYLLREVDVSLKDNVDRWSQLSVENLQREIGRRTQRDPTRRYPAVLLGSAGTRLAGGIEIDERTVPGYDRAFDLTLVYADDRTRPLRAFARVLPSGHVLIVTQDIHELREFSERLRAVIAIGLLLFVLVGLAGAMAFGLSAHRRLESMRRALAGIVDGDLSARLPASRSQDDLARIATMVNHMLDDIERLMGEVKGVTDGIAHDLRTPLTRMLASLERARTQAPAREELLDVVDKAIVDGRALMQMFTGLLRIAEIEDVVRRDNFEDVDLRSLCADVVDYYEPLAQDRGIALVLEADSSAPTLSGDANLLFDAVANLVDNALKFTPAGGRVVVALSASGTTHGTGSEAGSAAGPLLSVRDTGPGIAPEERELVFSRFYRGEKSRHQPGHGLGLSLVAAIARLHRLELTIGDASPGCVIGLRPTP